MTLTPEERAAFVALLPHLAPDDDPQPWFALFQRHAAEALDEIGARPGFDAVRAGLIRTLDRVVTAEQRAELVEAAWAALEGYEDDLSGDVPSALMLRDPAWAGLCALELAAWAPDRLPEPLVYARGVARAGYLKTGAQAGDGEVLWALGERALEVGWTDRALPVLRAAVEAPFAEPENSARARLVLAGALEAAGDTVGADIELRLIVDSEDADAPTRIQSLWTLAAGEVDAGDLDAARAHLDTAHEEALAEGDELVAERIRGFRDSLDAEA